MGKELIWQDAIWILPLLIFMCLIAINLVTAIVLCMARYSRNPLISIDLPRRASFKAIIADLESWAIEHGFEQVGTFRSIGNTEIAAWQLKNEPTYLITYTVGFRSMDFSTVLNGNKGLDTSNSADSCLYPREPGNFAQTFPGSTLDEQWELHKQALEFLKHNFDTQVRSDYKGFEDSFIAGLQEPAKYVMSIPFWLFRTPYWFFIRRIRMRKLTIEEQFNLKLIEK